MDRIIEVKVSGNYIRKDNKNAGVKGEAEVTNLRITFDEGWDNYAKSITFWDALGGNPVKRTLTADLIDDLAENQRIYLVPIPKEPMSEAGMLTFVIDGYFEGKRQRSISDALEVKDSPFADNAGEPTDPTPTQAEQLQGQIDKFMDELHETAVHAKNVEENVKKASTSEQNALASAERAEEYAQQTQTNSDEAKTYSNEAKSYSEASGESANYSARCSELAHEAIGKTNYIGDDDYWYAWDSEKGEFYNTGTRAKAGSTVHYGDNPPDEADVWIDPEGETGVYVTNEELSEKLHEYAKQNDMEDVVCWRDEMLHSYTVWFENYESLVAWFNEGRGLYDAWEDRTNYTMCGGQYVYISDVNLPDLVVSKVWWNGAKKYNFTTNEAFINQIKTDGFVRVGDYEFGFVKTISDGTTMEDVNNAINEAIGAVLGGSS